MSQLSLTNATEPKYDHSLESDSGYFILEELGLTPAKDQDCLGTCTSFAVGASLEYAFKDENFITSEAYFTVAVEDDRKSGLSVSKGMEFAKSHGFISESNWSYKGYIKALCSRHGIKYKDRWEEDNKKKLNDDIYAMPPMFPVEPEKKKFSYISDTTELYHRSRWSSGGEDYANRIKNVIFNHKLPVVVSVPIWWKKDGIDAGWEEESDGCIKMPIKTLAIEDANTEHTKKSKGWHVILIYGYKNNEKIFKFKNSWGTSWGTKGFGTLPYQYITEFSDIAMYGKR